MGPSGTFSPGPFCFPDTPSLGFPGGSDETVESNFSGLPPWPAVGLLVLVSTHGPSCCFPSFPSTGASGVPFDPVLDDAPIASPLAFAISRWAREGSAGARSATVVAMVGRRKRRIGETWTFMVNGINERNVSCKIRDNCPGNGERKE